MGWISGRVPEWTVEGAQADAIGQSDQRKEVRGRRKGRLGISTTTSLKLYQLGSLDTSTRRDGAAAIRQWNACHGQH